MGQKAISADWIDQVSGELDLRRKRNKAITNTIIQRARWLEDDDRQLILAMFRDGQSAQTIARRFDLCPRKTRRRIKQLVSRLNDPRVAYVVEHHDHWSKSRRAIAHALFIKGQSMRDATDTLGVSFYSVRKHREAINAMCQASIKESIRTWR